MKALFVVRAAALALSLSATAWATEMYKWVDEQGNVSYSQSPPPDARNLRKIAPPPPPPTRPETPATKPAPAAGEKAPLDEEALREEIAAAKKKNCDTARRNAEIYRAFRRVQEPDGQVVLLDGETRAAKIREAEEEIKLYCQ